MIADKIVVFDLETAGLDIGKPIIQIAAVAVDTWDQWRELGTFEVKIQFSEDDADAEALAINSYDPDTWKREATCPSLAASRFSAFLNQYRCVTCISKRGKPYQVAKLCGHNASGFDGPRLRHFYGEMLRNPGEQYGPFLPAHPSVLDTWQLAEWYFQVGGISPPPDFKLETLCGYFNIPIEGAHDALTDVRATAALAKKLCHNIASNHHER